MRASSEPAFRRSALSFTRRWSSRECRRLPMTRVGFEPMTYGSKVMTDSSSGFYLHRLRSLFPRGIRKFQPACASEFDPVYARLAHHSAHYIHGPYCFHPVCSYFKSSSPLSPSWELSPLSVWWKCRRYGRASVTDERG